MIEYDLRIQHSQGLHARQAAELSQYAEKSGCDIYFMKGKKNVNVRRFMELLSLKIKEGDMVHIIIHGRDEEKVKAGLNHYLIK